MSDYYQQFTTYLHSLDDPKHIAPSYREYLEGRLGIAAAKVQKCEEEQAVQARYLLEFVDRLWKALGIGGDWQTVPFAVKTIEERIASREAELAVYRAVHLSANVDAGQDGD